MHYDCLKRHLGLLGERGRKGKGGKGGISSPFKGSQSRAKEKGLYLPVLVTVADACVHVHALRPSAAQSLLSVHVLWSLTMQKHVSNAESDGQCLSCQGYKISCLICSQVLTFRL